MNYDAVKHYYVIGGGTMVDIAPHLSLCSSAFGKIAKEIYYELSNVYSKQNNVHLVLTHMADSNFLQNNKDVHLSSIFKQANLTKIRTNDDLKTFIDILTSREDTKCIVLTSAIVDFEVKSLYEEFANDLIPICLKKSNKRLSSNCNYSIDLSPSEKIIQQIRRYRKDIFLVGFKTTSNETRKEQYNKGLKLLKEASCNLVVANDIVTHNNFIITPEEAIYYETSSRQKLSECLAEMIFHRSQLTFTKSTVVDGKPIPWDSELVPSALREVVNHMINRKAYKPFLGKTVGHFAAKLDDTTFLTSIRKTNFNDLHKNGLVMIKTDGPDSVIAYGARPSVGGQSQRIIFKEHPGLDCIVHAHVPIKKDSLIPIVSQAEYECGSHECGKNTSQGLKQFNNGIWAVMLDKHGPNIVFSKNTNPQLVINFIEENFDLENKTE